MCGRPVGNLRFKRETAQNKLFRRCFNYCTVYQFNFLIIQKRTKQEIRLPSPFPRLLHALSLLNGKISGSQTTEVKVAWSAWAAWLSREETGATGETESKQGTELKWWQTLPHLYHIQTWRSVCLRGLLVSPLKHWPVCHFYQQQLNPLSAIL